LVAQNLSERVEYVGELWKKDGKQCQCHDYREFYMD
jgi:hypothetical protein